MTKELVSQGNLESMVHQLRGLIAHASQSLNGRLTRVDLELSDGPLNLKIGIEAASPTDGAALPTDGAALPTNGGATSIMTDGDVGGGVAEPLWNKPGHGVVAIVARSLLEAQNPDVWDKLDNLLQSDPAGRSSIAKAARWPDDAKKDAAFHKATGLFHYVDIVWQEGTKPKAKATLPKAPNAVSKLPEFASQFLKASGQKQVDALSWVLHLVGDLHQPLHCATRVNAANPAPQGDRGGNNFKLSTSTKELHALWDGLLVVGDKTTETKLGQIAASIANDFPESSFTKKELAQADPAAWAREGYLLAVKSAYQGVVEGGKPSATYMKNAKAIARQRAALGGYRLARMLVKLASQM